LKKIFKKQKQENRNERQEKILISSLVSRLLSLEGGIAMAFFAGKKVIALGDRDGIPGPAIEEVVKASGGEIVFSATECFV